MQILRIGLIMFFLAISLAATGILVLVAIAGWFFILSLILMFSGYKGSKGGKKRSTMTDV